MKELSQEQKSSILASIRDIKDFPKPGIVFKDITTLLNDKVAYKLTMEHLKARYEDLELDFIAGIESRGFIFGATLAQMLGIGFVPIRKKGKLPHTTIAQKYSLEYGFDEVELHIDAFRDKKDARVLLIDDLIATGGTAEAAVKLIGEAEAQCVEACFLLHLTFLDGKSKVDSLTNVYTVLDI
jgi:adenine phosphoribosyltransferase